LSSGDDHASSRRKKDNSSSRHSACKSSHHHRYTSNSHRQVSASHSNNKGLYQHPAASTFGSIPPCLSPVAATRTQKILSQAISSTSAPSTFVSSSGDDGGDDGFFCEIYLFFIQLLSELFVNLKIVVHKF
jgi:hypothetical protein